MNKKKTKILIPIFFLIFLSIPIKPLNAAVPPLISEIPDRVEVLWATGSNNSPTHLNPWSTIPDPWAILMFEPLFGYNEKTQVYIPCIGLDFEWTPGEGGRNITIYLNPNANWSDGRQINATDVINSYKMAQYQNKWKIEFPKRFVDFHIIDSETVKFELLPNATYSKKVLGWISSDVPILPWEGVYEQINETYADSEGNLNLFDNDWWDLAFNEDWKVCSGPYAPVYRNITEIESIFQKRDDWWGNTTTYSLYPDLPNWNIGGHPQYVGHKKIQGIPEQNTALQNGEVDLNSHFPIDMKYVWEGTSPDDYSYYINCWNMQEDPPHATEGDLYSVGINHERNELFNKSWFREALAWCIDYDQISKDFGYGYWKRAMPGFIDNESFSHIPFFNDTIYTDYMRILNFTKAAEILIDAGCSGSIGGPWYLPSSMGGGQIGPFKMICPIGWDDVNIITKYVCANFTTFGISTTIDPIDAGVNWNTWVSRIVDRDYDFMAHVGIPKVVREKPEVLLNGFREDKDWNINVTGWYGAEAERFDSLYRQLEIENDTVRFQWLLDEMQLILAAEIPEIPCFVTPYFYTYSNYFWEGWVNANNDFQQVCSEITNDQFVIKHRMILNLISTGRQPIDTTSPTWVEEPTDQTTDLGEIFTYDVEATDDSGTVYYMINDTTNFIINPNTGLITNNTILVEVFNYLNITAYDPSGNYNDSIIKITVIIPIDTTSPAWVEEPTDQTTNLGEIFTYDVEATDDSGTVYYMINDTTNFIINPNTGLITNNTILEAGTYYLEITAYDPSDNDIQTIIKITIVGGDKDEIPGYNFMILIVGMFISTITVGIYKWKKLYQK